ncbi:MAG TPA: hypothetical protein VFU54_14205 [Actinomycetota bacterium]|nr:hypothetical protein [Actinomycetota bacterium]
MTQDGGTTRLAGVERAIETGMLAGMAAAVPMGIFAMIASATWQRAGFYTPWYRIASVLDPLPLEASLEEAAADTPSFYFYPQPMFAGFAVHLAIGGFFGVLFVLLVRALRVRGRAAVAAGLLYGLAVAALMGLVLLPVAAEQLGGGRQIAEAASIVGWPTFAAWHLLYGLGLGIWMALRP